MWTSTYIPCQPTPLPPTRCPSPNPLPFTRPTPLPPLAAAQCNASCRLAGNPGAVLRIDEAAQTVTAPAGITQRTLLQYLDRYR